VPCFPASLVYKANYPSKTGKLHEFPDFSVIFAGFSNSKSDMPLKRILLEWMQGFFEGWGLQGPIGKRKERF
jgi:hypothetical protein